MFKNKNNKKERKKKLWTMKEALFGGLCIEVLYNLILTNLSIS